MAHHLDLEEQEQLDQLKHFWKTWGNAISMVALVVAVALAGWNGYQFWQNRQAGQAAALLDAIDEAVVAKDAARMELVFNDMRTKFAGTTQAGLAGLAVGKAAMEAGNSALAKSTLTWVADSAADEGYKALARLRLATVLMQEKAYDEALKQLSVQMAPEYAMLAADRKGDVLVQQGKTAEAAEEYQRAWNAAQESSEYRRVVEVKLNALGRKPAEAPSTAGVGK